jgi:hypothetical protein
MFDTIYNVPSNPGGIDVDRVFLIGTETTASASELVINGVQPYVPSILTGDYTHGKPVWHDFILFLEVGRLRPSSYYF